ncbi:uncharacterized protein O3C94_013201 [Discoglossus pictus]
MQKSIAEVLVQVKAGRCVGIEIFNKTNSITLSSPSTFCESGYVFCPPTPTISPGSMESCVFVKTPNTACGSVGVLVYHFSTSSLAIMFSNPFDYNLHNTTFAIWINNEICYANSQIFNDLYYNKPLSSSFQRIQLKSETQTLKVSNDNLVVSATMSNDYKAILKVEIRDKNHASFSSD